LEQAAAEEARPAVAVPRRRMVLAAALMAIFMPAVESSIVATALPTIIGHLGGFHLFSWVFAVPFLTMAVTIPLYGRLADIYGRRRVFFIGTAIFLTGTTLCGFARSMELLIAFRAIQGIGSGAIQPIAMTIVGDIYTPAQRARIQGAMSAVWGFAAVVGPAASAFLIETVHWSVVFWVNLPIGIVSVAMFALFLNERVERREHRLDYLGGGLLIVGVGALMLALVQALTLGTAAIAALVAVGVGALFWLLVHERRAPEPMLPLGLWRQRVLALCNIGGFGASVTYMAVSALLPTYVQGAMGYSAGVSGFVVGAASVCWMFASIAAGRLMVHTSYRLTFAIGSGSLIAGSLVLLMLDPGAGVLWPVLGSLLIGNGMGFCNTTFIVAIQGTVAWRERGVATGSQMFMRMIGMSVGAALFGAIVNFGVHQHLPGTGDTVNRLLRPEVRETLGAEQIAHLADAIALAAQDAFAVAAIIAAGTLALVWAFPRGLNPTRSPERRERGRMKRVRPDASRPTGSAV
jgi:EmrB/QacA subfamily drug resistance transporter